VVFRRAVKIFGGFTATSAKIWLGGYRLRHGSINKLSVLLNFSVIAADVTGMSLTCVSLLQAEHFLDFALQAQILVSCIVLNIEKVLVENHIISSSMCNLYIDGGDVMTRTFDVKNDSHSLV